MSGNGTSLDSISAASPGADQSTPPPIHLEVAHMLLSAAVRVFLSYCADEKALCTKTINAYRIDLHQFCTFCSRTHPNLRVVQVDKNTIIGYLKCISKDYKPKSIIRKYASIRAFFRYLEFEDIIENSPTRKIRFSVRDSCAIPRDISQHDLTALLSYMYRMLRATPSDTSAYRVYLRDTAVLELLFATGIRVSELSHLSPSDVDLHQRIIRVLGKGHKERSVPLCCEQVIAVLSAYHESAPSITRDWFFINRSGNRLTEQSIRNLVRKHGVSAGISQHITPHMFRHTCATQLLRSGMDIRGIQGILGHSSVTTTQIYTHLSTRSQRENIERYHPRSSLPICP